MNYVSLHKRGEDKYFRERQTPYEKVKNTIDWNQNKCDIIERHLKAYQFITVYAGCTVNQLDL